jgi:hypothetical protein
VKTGYSCDTEADVLLTAGVAKTVLGVQGNAAFGVDWLGYTLGFDGVTIGAVPVLVQVVYITFASNPPGTNSTLVSINTNYGRAVASGMTAARTWTAEPTVVSTLSEYRLTPDAGTIIRDFSRDRTPDSAFSEGFGLRLLAAAGVNVRASLMFERA